MDIATEQSAEDAENARMLALQANTREIRTEFEAVLAYEAWLLDSDRLENWLALLADDVRYVAPVRRKVPNEMLDVRSIGQAPSFVAHFNDGKPELQLRVKRLRTGYNHYHIPMALHRRVVSNLLVLDWDEVLGEATISSSFMAFRAREEKEEAFFVGQRDDVWRKDGEGWLLARRLIKLDHHIVPPISILF